MQVKTCPAQIKAAGTHEGTEEGVFEAIVAAYNVDSVNDRIIPGAFKASLEQWKTKGSPIPVIWSHKADDPDYHIGYVEEAEERPEGLWVRGRIDIDDPRSKSAQVYRLLKGRRVGNFSFAYDIDEARPGKKDDGSEVQELHRLTLHEVGPCLIGANRATALLDVKHDQQGSVTVNVGAMSPNDFRAANGLDATQAAPTAPFTYTTDTATGAKAGRVLSRKNEDALTSALAKMDAAVAEVRSVLAATGAGESGPDGDGESAAESNAEKATPNAPAAAPDTQVADQAAPASKSDEPAQSGTASERLRIELALAELESYTL